MAITEYYVSVSGAGAHDGTSEANALTLSEMFTQIAALGAGGGAGRRYNIKGSHTARAASDTLSRGGTISAPLILRGYSSSIGDGSMARSSGGALDTTNSASIAYNSTYGLTQSENYVVYEALNISGTANSATGLVNCNGRSYTRFTNCKIDNASTGGSAVALCIGSWNHVTNCDISTATGGGLAAMNINGLANIVLGCRITSGGIGMYVQYGNDIALNTIYNCGGIGIYVSNAAATVNIIQNTITGCTGNAIEYVSSETAFQMIVGNTVTDNTGKWLYMPSIACDVFQAFNRLVNNGASPTTSDWIDGATTMNVTTAGGAGADYTDDGSEDYSLVAASPAISASVSYLIDAGANGTPVVTGGGGGAMVIGG